MLIIYSSKSQSRKTNFIKLVFVVVVVVVVVVFNTNKN